MSDNDDLFEFEDFDDDDLELDLDHLFGDLTSLAVDTDDPSLLDPFATPIEALDEPAPQEPDPTPVAEAPAAPAAQPLTAQAEPAAAPAAQAYVPPAPQPAPAPQPLPSQAAPMSAGQVAGLDPASLQPQPAKPRRNKTVLAIGAAAVVTCANLAAMAIPHLAGSDVEQPQDPTPTAAEVVEPEIPEGPSPEHLALMERIAQLESEVQRVGSPDAGILPSRGDHLRVIDEAQSMVARGDYLGARKRLYSLLAIVDRLPARERDRNEALASYLLADTYKLEAQGLDQEAGL